MDMSKKSCNFAPDLKNNHPMKKYLFLLLALTCLFSCKDGNNPTNPNDHNAGGNNSATEGFIPTFIPRKVIICTEFPNGTKNRSVQLYEYNANNDLSKLSLYRDGRLADEHIYTWNGNVRYGVGTNYNTAGMETAHTYDTINYLDNQRQYYSRLALKQVFPDTTYYTVEEYRYEGYGPDNLMNYKHYENGVLDVDFQYMIDARGRYGVTRDIPNSWYISQTDTMTFWRRRLPSQYVLWTVQEDRTSMALWDYQYKENATYEHQLSGYFFETQIWNNDDTHYSSYQSAHYRWSGDTIRYGSGSVADNNVLSYNTTDTTYYLIVNKD